MRKTLTVTSGVRQAFLIIGIIDTRISIAKEPNQRQPQKQPAKFESMPKSMHGNRLLFSIVSFLFFDVLESWDSPLWRSPTEHLDANPNAGRNAFFNVQLFVELDELSDFPAVQPNVDFSASIVARGPATDCNG